MSTLKERVRDLHLKHSKRQSLGFQKLYDGGCSLIRMRCNHERANLSHVSLTAHFTGLKNLPTEELSASQGGVVVRVIVGVVVNF